MTSYRQINANRRNAFKSTGPKTETGKQVGSAICPTMPSTASVAMKLSFGAKPGRFCLRSTIWIAASHRRECGVSVLAVNNNSQASGAKSVEVGTQRPDPSLVRNHNSDKVSELGQILPVLGPSTFASDKCDSRG
jgi:hypothetical protein